MGSDYIKKEIQSFQTEQYHQYCKCICFRIIELNQGKPPLTYKNFIKVISKMKPPPTPAPALCHRIIGHSVTPISDDHDQKWGVPTLAELGTVATIYNNKHFL